MKSPLARRLLLRLLPDDDWSAEFLAELDAEHARVVERRGSDAHTRLWYARQLLSPLTLRFVWRMRRRAARSTNPGNDAKGMKTKASRRETLTFSWLDFKLGFRMLARYPGLTLVGGLAMAFGVWIGAVTFEMTRQWIRPDLGLEDSSRIVGLHFTNAVAPGVGRATFQDFVGWRDEVRSVEALSAFRLTESNLITSGSAGEPLQVAEITASAFAVTRVPPHLGRFLVEADEAPGAPPVVVLGYEVWQERFAADPAVVGQTVHLGGDARAVVGVMPPGFAFPFHNEAWTPLPAAVTTGSPGPRLYVFGRLAEGVELGEAQTELRLLGERASVDAPETHQHLRPQVVPYVRSILPLEPSEVLGLRWVNLLVVGLVALVCGNVALLLFARAATRESEIVVRSALGASRGRIVSQLFAEALVLAAAGTVVGLIAARQGTRFALFILGENLGDLPYWVSAGISPATLAYAVALTLLGAAIAGVLPALRVTRALAARLRQAGAGGGGLRFSGVWTGVIVAQVAVSVTFPVAALFLWRLGAPIRSFEVGFAEEAFLSVELVPDAAGAGGLTTLEELERRLSAEPAVAGVTFAERLPRMYHPDHAVEAEGARRPADAVAASEVKTASVAPGYFELLGAPIVAGRAFHAGDLEPGRRAVIVNRSFVDEVLGGLSAVGRRVRFVDGGAQGGPAPEPAPWYEIVGVVGDLGMYHEGGRAGLYHPLALGSGPVYGLIEVRGDPTAFAPRLRAVANAVDPTLQLEDVRPLSELGAGLVRAVDTFVQSALAVSALALLLSLASIYSVMAFAVSRRTREIGVRVALGADARRLLFAVFRRPLLQVTLGVMVGGGLVAVVVRGVMGYLSARELGLVAAYAVLMMAVCMLACVVPTRRALRIEPVEALREET